MSIPVPHFDCSEAISRLEAVIAAMSDEAALGAAFGEHMVEKTRESLTAGGTEGRGGQPFVPTSSWVLDKEGRDGVPLMWTLELFNSIHWEFEGGGVAVGSDLYYAPLMLNGGARDFLRQTDRDTGKWVPGGWIEEAGDGFLAGGPQDYRHHDAEHSHFNNIPERPFLAVFESDWETFGPKLETLWGWH